MTRKKLWILPLVCQQLMKSATKTANTKHTHRTKQHTQQARISTTPPPRSFSPNQ